MSSNDKPDSETREIKTDYLARVEGEGAMLVRLRGGEVEEVQFKIFEPPRFFEALLRGRHFTEAPDITARICGICPMAYITSACNAMEAACGVELPEPIRLCADSSTAASGSRATCSTPRCCTPLTSSGTTAQSRWRAIIVIWSRPRCG